jgi:hypothetical protein
LFLPGDSKQLIEHEPLFSEAFRAFHNHRMG